ncbi:MAG: nitroreductase family protein [Ilumatobacteraceae bacterium]
MDPLSFASLARTRRTSMLVDLSRPVPRDLVEHLCDLAQWAPNHKRTWPWEFALVDGDGRSTLGTVIADAMAAHGDDPDKVDKARGKYLRTPATLVVASAPGDSELRTVENRDAVAAGVQNILLAGTAHGLATYWGSCPKGANDAVTALCGFETGSTVVAIIYLGWAAEQPEPPERPPVDLRIIDR